MNELTADERSRRRGWMARIVPIIRNPSNALPSLNDHYFVRCICNNEPSLRRWPAGLTAGVKTSFGADYYQSATLDE
jgi:hypothetical protein